MPVQDRHRCLVLPHGIQSLCLGHVHEKRGVLPGCLGYRFLQRSGTDEIGRSGRFQTLWRRAGLLPGLVVEVLVVPPYQFFYAFDQFSEIPRLRGENDLVAIKVTLGFPNRRALPDVDNAMRALKPLLDLLEPLRAISLGQRGMITRGFLGVVEDDALLE